MNGPDTAKAIADWVEARLAMGNCPASAETLVENLAKMAVAILHQRGIGATVQ